MAAITEEAINRVVACNCLAGFKKFLSKQNVKEPPVASVWRKKRRCALNCSILKNDIQAQSLKKVKSIKMSLAKSHSPKKIFSSDHWLLVGIFLNVRELLIGSFGSFLLSLTLALAFKCVFLYFKPKNAVQLVGMHMSRKPLSARCSTS